MFIHSDYHKIIALLSFFYLRAGCFETGLRTVVERYNHGETHAQIVLMRHGESEANEKRLFSWPAVPLTKKGCDEVESAATTLKGHRIAFDRAYTSGFKRAQDSLTITLETLGYAKSNIPIKKAPELNTRTFGEWTGRPYAEARATLGSENVNHWFGIDYKNFPDVPPRGGETLEDCDKRAQAYYTQEIHRKVLAGEKILVVASRNPIYSLMQKIEGDKLKEVPIDDMKTALPIIYQLDYRGNVLDVPFIIEHV
ncbi:hypothetical protein PGT21_014841 [Puccinia graminis f. sp. tritici]|uniref:phosphoglycerate mutase (2,3-diphosphoglycerate-dependent) n=1 Tax=Puccinia graminis f. sp. tritici TaxID=56615 RepID=A0A5B0QIJ3_PUCGR|nr:hypothetical protein PGT21_014841 [Puccinia graminis f. sp. tritici]